MLYERQYVTSLNIDDPAANRYSHDVRIFRALLAGAFYPNLVMAAARQPKTCVSVASNVEGGLLLHSNRRDLLLDTSANCWVTFRRSQHAA